MAKHTPGKWNVRQWSACDDDGAVENTGLQVVAINGQEECAISCVCDESDTGREEADLLLIAAAPELLEALTMVRDADDDCKRDGLPTIPRVARAKIDAALKKATGETP